MTMMDRIQGRGEPPLSSGKGNDPPKAGSRRIADAYIVE